MNVGLTGGVGEAIEAQGLTTTEQFLFPHAQNSGLLGFRSPKFCNKM